MFFFVFEGAQSRDAAAKVELFCVFGDVLLERDSMTDLFEIDRASHLKDFDRYRSR